MSISHPKPSFIGHEASQLTRNASRMFQNLRMVEIGFTGRKIVREAIKFFRNAAQFLLQVRLDGHFRQSPGVVGLCVVMR